MTSCRQYWLIVLNIALTISMSSAFAQHVDLKPELTAEDKYVVEYEISPPGPAPLSTTIKPGLKIFQYDFGELGNPFGTDDPGIESTGLGDPFELLAFEAHGSLMKWDGDSWLTGGFDEIFTISDALNDIVTISSSGVSGGSSLGGVGVSLIDQLGSGGSIHSHVEFAIESPTGDPMNGAYMVELSLFGLESDGITRVHTPSDNFLIVFQLDAENNGPAFDDMALQESLDALMEEPSSTTVAQVPISGGILLGTALMVIGGIRARRLY